MSDPNFDGKCGIPFRVPTRGGQYLRCQHDMGHAGDHSWVKYEDQFILHGCTHRTSLDELIRRCYGTGEAGARLVVEAIADSIDD